jgi:3-dehydroquinate synthase/shikimate kinase/3-dehydroquinate synthase
MKPIKLKISTKTQKYPIIIGSNLIQIYQKFQKIIQLILKNVLLVIDKNSKKNYF